MSFAIGVMMGVRDGFEKMNNQQEQEEHQQKILEEIETFKIHLEKWYRSDNCEEGLEFFLDKLNFLASECGIGEIWRKRNGD